MKETYRDFLADWQQGYTDEPLILLTHFAFLFMFYVVLYAIQKVSPTKTIKQRGRKTDSEYRQIEGFYAPKMKI
ncbi:MAG: hypothetical protein ACTS73_02950 [Arsenophonus sp. NEOnobi-MAG3]